MSTIGVYDADFFRYQNVIPNLECAKLITYFRRTGELSALSPQFSPERYTNFYIRKEYNDGIFPKEYHTKNCILGGRAFGSDKYIPLPDEIEYIVPNIHAYDKYLKFYSPTKTLQKQLQRILNCSHIRLAPDGTNCSDISYLMKNIESTSGIFLHDYHLENVKDATDVLKELSSSRHFKERPKEIHYLPICNKFPIHFTSQEDLEKWFDITVLSYGFFAEYHGVFDDEFCKYLIEQDKRLVLQLYYKIDSLCSDENDFLFNYLPKIFKQVVFFRSHQIKILLKYDASIIHSKELQNLIEILNCWLKFGWDYPDGPIIERLASFLSKYKKYQYTSWAFLKGIQVTVEEARESFQYIRERFYELFEMFYQVYNVKLVNGEFVNDWTGNQNEN